MTHFEIYQVRQRACYLAKLYDYAIEYYDTINSFIDIAKLSILHVNRSMGILNCDSRAMGIKSYQTLLKWFRIYRENDCFPNPHLNKIEVQSMLPPFLSANPDIIDQINSYCKSNLSAVSVELVFDRLHGHIIPNFVKKIKEERGVSEYTSESLFKEYGLSKLTIVTVGRWMNKLGYTYEPLKKTYYVDNHETEENIAYRNEFVKRYFSYEIRSYRWYQITAAESDAMIANNELDEKLGYKYRHNGVDMVEYHVDDHKLFAAKCSSLQYGGNLSIHKPPTQKPLMIIGQDECIFKQYIFKKKYWVLPDGTRQLIPKDEGQGLMLSSFCCRELGYGYSPSDSILQAVNVKRKGTTYSDESAATLKQGNANKKPLTTTPFVRKLEYGNTNEGYWSYECMILQLEDIIDILQHQFPEFDFVFLFDHSNGHDRLQPIGLNLNKISIRFGGKQPIMRESKLNDDELFGPYHSPSDPLQPGMTQSMQFQSTDIGPCYLSIDERVKQQYDINSGEIKERFRSKDELKLSLTQAGILNPVGTRRHLQEQCEQLGLAVKKSIPKIAEGWEGKPKGALQILYERGWINPSMISHYTASGKKDSDLVSNGIPVCPFNYSIWSIMEMQKDFANEITLLQFHAQKLGVMLDRSPKCHPEIAGEGIEYAWALSKLHYRRSPIQSKRTKTKFQNLVDESTNPRTVLNIQRQRACSKKARSYMKMYSVIQSLEMDVKKAAGTHAILESTIKLYLKLKKKGKSHRSVADRHHRDVTDIEMSNTLATSMETHGTHVIKKEAESDLINFLVSKMNSSLNN